MLLHYYASILLLLLLNGRVKAQGRKDAADLFQELLFSYDKFVRPIKDAGEIMEVKFGASLIRIIDVDEVHQVITTSLWMEMQWYDYRFTWDPLEFNGIKKLHIPSDQIWTPDILLYNNAYGEPHISIVSNALVYYDGAIVWKPPSIYKSFCNISTEYFPYDIQSCIMKFGGWTYNGNLLNITQIPVRQEDTPQWVTDEDKDGCLYLERGMDLSFYYPSAEWDLLNLTSRRHQKMYPGCCGLDAYVDVTFNLVIRRKALFFTLILVIPCMLVAIVMTFVFYIPPREHKMTYSIQTLVALTFFYLLLVELIPPSSIAMPLIAKYLLLTLILLTASIFISIYTIRVYRDASGNPIPRWMRYVFLQKLPKYLFLKPPSEEMLQEIDASSSDLSSSFARRETSRRSSSYFLQQFSGDVRLSQLAQLRGMHPDLIRRMIDNVSFISDQFRSFENDGRVSEEWAYVAIALDRFWHMLFSFINLSGVLAIFLQSPSLYDLRLPLSIQSPLRPLTADISDSNRTL